MKLNFEVAVDGMSSQLASLILDEGYHAKFAKVESGADKYQIEGMKLEPDPRPNPTSSTVHYKAAVRVRRLPA